MPANARHRHTAHPPDLAALLPSWELALRSERKRPSTIEQYTIGVRLFLHWCHANHHTPAIDRTLVEGFVADLLADGIAPSTAVLRQQCLRQFAKWLVEEGELAADPLLGLKAPKVDIKVVEGIDFFLAVTPRTGLAASREVMAGEQRRRLECDLTQGPHAALCSRLSGVRVAVLAGFSQFCELLPRIFAICVPISGLSST